MSYIEIICKTVVINHYLKITFARLSATCVLGFLFTATVLTPGEPVWRRIAFSRFCLRPWSGTGALLSFEALLSSTIFKSSISGALEIWNTINPWDILDTTWNYKTYA